MISIGYLIKNICNEKGITARRLCDGICSTSYFSEFTKNEKSVNKLISELLLQRLGLFEGNFENYLSEKEFNKFMMRNKIISLIEKKEIQKAEKEIEEYEKIVLKKDRLERRFKLLMEFGIMQIKNNGKDSQQLYEKIYLTLKEAVKITVPIFEDFPIDECILGYNELYFILKCIMFREKVYSDCKSQILYNELIEYIKNSDLDYSMKARLYSNAVCLAAKTQILNKEYELVIKNCDLAIEYLNKSSKLYFIEELMKNKGLALKALINLYDDKASISKSDMKKLNLYKNILIKNEKKRELITKVFEKYNLSSEPSKWYPYNGNEDFCSLGETIKKRREMLNMSQFELSEDIYDTVSISRIETGLSAPYPKKSKMLLKKLGIFGEFQIYDFECNGYEAYKLEKEMSYLLTLKEYKRAYDILQKLKEKIDMSSNLNQQYFGYKEASILNNLKIISEEDTIDRYIKALEITVSTKKIFSDTTKKYFTKREKALIYGIGLSYKKLEDYENSDKWLSLHNDYHNNFDKNCQFITYEEVSAVYESLVADMKKYEKSYDTIEKSIYESLKCRGDGLIGRLVYSPVWGIKERTDNKTQNSGLLLDRDEIEKALVINALSEAGFFKNEDLS